LLIGIVAHWLDEDFIKQEVFIDLRRLTGLHSSKNIAAVVILLLQEYELGSKLSFFMGDNIVINDITIRCILKSLRPDIKNPNDRRIRRLNHIINLTARAFLFSKDCDSFKANSCDKKKG
jgi:hypothetical protein